MRQGVQRGEESVEERREEGKGVTGGTTTSERNSFVAANSMCMHHFRARKVWRSVEEGREEVRGLARERGECRGRQGGNIQTYMYQVHQWLCLGILVFSLCFIPVVRWFDSR